MARKKHGTGIREGSTDRIVGKRHIIRYPQPPRTRFGRGVGAAKRGRQNLAASLRVPVRDLSKRTRTRKQARLEVSKIRKKVVLPRYSKLSPLNCAKKRRLARRDYFAYKGTGRGARSIRRRPHKNRFTVRC